MASKRNHGRDGGGRDRRLAAIAADHEGVVALEHLRAAGVSPRASGDRANTGRLHRIHRGVYTVGHRSLTRTGELRAAALACGEGSVISHGTSRTLIDLAGMLGLPSLRRAVERAAVLKLLDLAELDRPLGEAKGRRGVPALREILADFLWEERRVVVETDGAATHQTPVAFQRDRRRDQLLVADGYRVTRATWSQIKHELDAVVTRIARTLALAEP